MNQLLHAVSNLDRDAAKAAIKRGQHPLSVIEPVVRGRDLIRLAFVLEFLPPTSLDAVRRLALRLYMLGNFPRERNALKRWIFNTRMAITSSTHLK